MPTRPLSVQLYTVRDAVADDLDAALARIAAIGFRTVELYGFVDAAADYAARLDRHGLTASSVHARILTDDTSEVARILEASRVVGAPYAIEPAVESERWADRAGVERIADRLNERAAIAAGLGIQIGYHNHWWEFSDLDGTPALEVLAGMLDPAVVLEIDTYWAQIAGVDAVGLLDRLGDRVQLIHVKDGPITREDPQVAVGDGAMPVREILARSAGRIPVVELDAYAGDVFDALERSFAYLTANGQRA